MMRNAIILLASCIGIAACLLAYYRWMHRNPYENAGLHVEWTYGGATSTVPCLKVWADYQGHRIDCPLVLGGISNPELRFYDYDHDGHDDIVFGDARDKQVVSFTPSHGDSPPKFKILRHDMSGWTNSQEAEQAGADQPATQPADKLPVKDQPSTPTSKGGPR